MQKEMTGPHTVAHLEVELETATEAFKQCPTKQARATLDHLHLDLNLCLIERAERNLR